MAAPVGLSRLLLSPSTPTSLSPLDEHLRKKGSLDMQEAVDIALAVCDALTEVHARGALHLAVGAHAVMLSVSPMGVSNVRLTEAHRLPSGGRYLRSPEQLRSGSKIDARADVWGVAVLLHTMLAGERPFSPSASGRSLTDADEPPSLAGVPDALAEAVERALSHDPARRQATMADFASALAPFASNPARARERISRRGISVAPPALESEVVEPPALESDPTLIIDEIDYDELAREQDALRSAKQPSPTPAVAAPTTVRHPVPTPAPVTVRAPVPAAAPVTVRAPVPTAAPVTARASVPIAAPVTARVSTPAPRAAAPSVAPGPNTPSVAPPAKTPSAPPAPLAKTPSAPPAPLAAKTPSTPPAKTPSAPPAALAKTPSAPPAPRASTPAPAPVVASVTPPPAVAAVAPKAPESEPALDSEDIIVDPAPSVRSLTPSEPPPPPAQQLLPTIARIEPAQADVRRPSGFWQNRVVRFVGIASAAACVALLVLAGTEGARLSRGTSTTNAMEAAQPAAKNVSAAAAAPPAPVSEPAADAPRVLRPTDLPGASNAAPAPAPRPMAAAAPVAPQKGKAAAAAPAPEKPSTETTRPAAPTPAATPASPASQPSPSGSSDELRRFLDDRR